MKKLIAFFAFISTLTFFYSCKETKKVYQFNLSIAETTKIASKTNKDFCIVLIKDSIQIVKYKHAIKNNGLDQFYIFNFIDIDIPANNWYQYLIGSIQTPFTLVFKDKKCRNIVFGISKYAIQSIKNTKDDITQNDNFGFLENSIFHLSSNACALIQQVLEYTSDSLYNQNILNSSLTQFTYPYNLFLKFQYHHLAHVKDSIDYYCFKLLSEFQNPEYNYIYNKLFEKVKKLNNLTNPLSFKTDQVHYSCKKDSTINLYVTVRNDTSIPLKITRVESSCECLTINYPAHIIEPNTSKVYNSSFSSNETGTHYREIFFYSDAEVPINIIGFNITVE